MDAGKAKKMGLTAVALTAAIGVGAAFGPSIAGAQESDDSTSEESETREGNGVRKFGKVRGEAFESLGLEKETIKEGRQAGLTLAEIAQAEGITQDDLVTAIVDGIVEHAEENDKELDRTEAELTEDVTERVNSVAERRGKAKKARALNAENREEIKAAIEAEDYDTARALMLENVDTALEEGAIDAEKAEALTERIENKDFSERAERQSKGERTDTSVEA